MTALWAWVRIDLRLRWNSLVVLALLVALASGTVMTAVAGAQRGSTAMERLAEETDTINVLAVPNTPHFDWAPFAELPYVESFSRFYLGVTPVIEGIPADVFTFPHDAAWGTDFERPVVLEGRMYDPEEPHELVVTPGFVERFGKGAGDSLKAFLASPEQADATAKSASAIDDASQMKGPEVDLLIVGVVRSPWTIDAQGQRGKVDLSPAFTARYERNIMGAEADHTWANGAFELERGAADMPKLHRDFERIAKRTDIDIWNFEEQLDAANRQLGFEGKSLLAFGGAALLAALVLVGQALGRYASAEAQELSTAAALGMTPRQALASSVVPPLGAAGTGALIGAAGSVVASRWFPIGTAADFEPHPGPSVDWWVLGIGLPATIAVAAVVAGTSAWSALRQADRDEQPRRSVVAAAAGNSGLGVPTQVGVRFALEKGRGRSAIPVRPALAGAVAGVLGVIAVMSFSHGIDDAVDHPERFGMTYQQFVFLGFNGQEHPKGDEIVAALEDLDYVTGVADDRNGVATVAGSEDTVAIHSHSDGEKPLPTVVLDGRFPEAPDEIALAPGTLDSLGTEVGDVISLTGSRGLGELRIVGSAFLARGPHNDYNQGGWLTADGYDRIFKDFKFQFVLVSVEESARTDGLSRRLADDVARAVPQAAGLEASHPDDEGLGTAQAQQNLEQVRVLPRVLACFLGLLAVGAVAHAIATAVRRRSHDLAVFRAVGLTPWQARRLVAVQATVFALVGIAFGIPLGMAVGRTAWRVVADFTPLAYVAPTAVMALLLIVPAALLVAYLVAALPAVRASRLRVAAVLRTE